MLTDVRKHDEQVKLTMDKPRIMEHQNSMFCVCQPPGTGDAGAELTFKRVLPLSQRDR